MNALQKWLRAATPEERARLARLCDTTPAVLSQWAGAYRTGGKLRLAAQSAAKLQHASEDMARPGLPSLLRSELCPVCRACPYAKAAAKKG